MHMTGALARARPLAPSSEQSVVSVVPDQAIEDFKLWAEYAFAAYQDVRYWNCEFCNKRTLGTTYVGEFYYGFPTIQGYVAMHHEYQVIVVGIRGSTADKLTSFATSTIVKKYRWPREVAQSQVHQGYFFSVKVVIKRVIAMLEPQAARYLNYRIVLTGHSLGGAQSVLMASFIAQQHSDWASRLSVYTYGQPRVGNAAFATYYQSLSIPTARVVNQHDIVPHIPTKAMGFKHQPFEIWIRPQDGVTVACPATVGKESPHCSAGVPFYKLNVLDHSHYWGISSKDA
ncbi:hypothetical protein H4R34_003948 [Dimargaris verticillata]|uniref:Fungal lipase-type domain-containing protein n=1 Tax=Dimargaris verticillata TaxID=2761393 RepID=A0A9W8AZW7_9FUNG|nr:hypothetical protein H4R34_003948 [Dimargaris verticillata]